MHGGYVSLFDMAICGLPAVAFAIWQIVSVSREIARDRQAPSAARHQKARGIR